MTLVFTEDYDPLNIFQFDNLSDFDNVDEVLFKLNGVIVKDINFVDASVSDRCFCFSANLETIFQKEIRNAYMQKLDICKEVFYEVYN